MSRTTRHYVRGAAFHIAARTIGDTWFEKCAERIEQIIVEGVLSSDAVLLAYAVMSNHFHIVLKQSARPLGWVMQPIMRRTALCAQRANGVRGHVYERPFRSALCENADHLRRAVVYTHVNPFRGGLCDQAGFYPWCSHLRINADEFCSEIDVPFITRLFARRPAASDSECLQDYLAYVQWRLRRDAAAAAGVEFHEPEPFAFGGDAHFQQHFAGSLSAKAIVLPDLRDHARYLLNLIDSNICLDDLRRSYISRPRSAIRKRLIAALLQAGYRAVSISRFLFVSETTVSKVAMQMRYAGLVKAV